MSSPSPAIAPVSDTVHSPLPPLSQPPSPENDQITPPSSPPLTLPISLPSLTPLIAPTLPIVVGYTPPPLPPPPQPPQSQPQPQPPLPSPPITTKNNPPIKPSPPPVSSDTKSDPIILPTSPPPQQPSQPPLTSPPIKNKNNPLTTKPSLPPISSTTTNNDPILPTSPPFPPPSTHQPKTRPIIKPRPFQQGPLRPKTPPSPLPTSAILPTSPPLPLPVPQTPNGGGWIPFSTESPTPLPILPGPPKTLSSPQGPINGGTITSSSSYQPNIGSDAFAPPKGSNNGANGFVVGLVVGGILLLFLGSVFGILFVFCKRRGKKKVGDNESGIKHTTLYNEFEEKSSLHQQKKHVSNNTLAHHTKINNMSTLKGPNMGTKGTPQMNVVGPTLINAPSFSNGSFTYEELSRATDGFSERNLLGQGGFGYVHKGVLANGKEVAVKQLKLGGHQGEREFRAEVETISQVHHKHLVSLVGYCIDGGERLLVYEFVPNNTLEFHLHGNGQPVMDWPTRLKIAIGSAKGFAYLHEDCSPTIIHRDIKAANILLDFNFEAKVSDFGMARIFSSTNPSATHITTRVVGTFGYLAPEYASSGKVTDKSDVYSYGVMLLELITGRPPISNFESSTTGSLVNWARPLLAQAIGDGKFETLVDPKLQNKYNVDEMTSMVACAAACVRLSAWRRPKMSQVVRALEGNLPPSELDDGTRPGQSSMHFPYESLDFDARNYMEDMKRMALTCNNGHTNTSRYSANTSEYGLNPSSSSTNSTINSVTQETDLIELSLAK